MVRLFSKNTVIFREAIFTIQFRLLINFKDTAFLSKTTFFENLLMKILLKKERPNYFKLNQIDFNFILEKNFFKGSKKIYSLNFLITVILDLLLVILFLFLTDRKFIQKRRKVVKPNLSMRLSWWPKRHKEMSLQK